MQPIFYKTKPKTGLHTVFVDAYTAAKEELFFIRNPRLKKIMPEAKFPLETFLKHTKVKDIWIYFPWKDTLVRTLNEQDYFTLRTSRNRDIITEKEQLNFRRLTVGIAGLSVGSAIFHSLVRTGGSKTLKIADYDNLEITNLNRISASLLNIGQNKTQLAAQSAFELDPFCKLMTFNNGLSSKNLKGFIAGKPKLNVFVDAMDDFRLKIMARKLCKKYKIPVIMATDNGNGVILDVERFDKEPSRAIFHGRLNKKDLSEIETPGFTRWLELAVKVIDPKNFSAGIRRTLPNLGKTVASVPQLGLAANLAGSIVTVALVKLANGQALPSGRYFINLDGILK